MKNRAEEKCPQPKEASRIVVRVILDEISKSSLRNQRRDMIENIEKDFKLFHRLGMLK